MLEKVQAFCAVNVLLAQIFVDSKRNFILSMSDVDLNEKLNNALDVARTEKGIIADEVYLCYSKGRPYALFGSDIQAWAVPFPPPSYFRTLKQGNARAGVVISDEDQYMRTYEICESKANEYLQDIKLTWKANDCGRGDVLVAVAVADEEHKRSLAILASMRKEYSSDVTEKAIANLTRLNMLITRLTALAVVQKRP